MVTAATVNAQIATDDYETGTIAYGYNGGSGYGALTFISGTNGGVYGENASSNNRQLDGAQSLGLFSASNSQAAGRSITSPITIGNFSLDARWDITNNSGNDAFTGINLDSALGASFGANELLSFGLVGGTNNTFLITDSSGTHTLAVGTDTELRGGIFHFSINFNTTTEAYSLTVTDKGNSQSGTISGSLITTGTVGAFKIQNVDTDTGNQNLIIDNTVAVPEPSVVALLAGSSVLGASFYMRRRRRA